jgi:hypothetical protein
MSLAWPMACLCPRLGRECDANGAASAGLTFGLIGTNQARNTIGLGRIANESSCSYGKSAISWFGVTRLEHSVVIPSHSTS